MENNRNNKGSKVGAPSNGMKVLMLSTDQNILKAGSAAWQRMIDYGTLFEELHIIIYINRGFRIQNLGFRASSNIFLYPTNSFSKWFYFFDAYKIAKSIFLNSKSHILNSWIITTQDPFETGLVGYLLKKKFGIPLQIQSHSDFLSPYFWKESLKNKLRVLLGKWLVKKADCIRVVSQRIKNSLMALYPSLSRVIAMLPVFVDTEKINAAPIKTDLHKKYPGYDFIILMASRLTKEKNIQLALEAFADVKNANQMRMTRTLLLIVGDGPERQNLEFRIKNLGLENNVKFESWTNDVISYYKTADLFLFTSNYEGGARAPAEAAAAGLPVIMTDVPPAGEIIKDGVNGFVVPVGNAGLLAEKITELINNDSMRKKFSDASFAITKKSFSTKEEYLKQYQKSLISIKAMRRIPIVVMTGNSWRHKYFVNTLTENFKVVGAVLVAERHIASGSAFQSHPIIEEHRRQREKREKAYFGQHSDFRLATEQILVINREETNSQRVFKWVAGRDPKYVVLFGTAIVKDPILSRFKGKIVNMHLGLSPYYRGDGTNFWPLVYGEPECAGATIHLAVLKVDAGSILGQARPDIAVSDDVHDIGFKAIIAGTRALIHCLRAYDSGEIDPRPQPAGVGKVFRSQDLTPESISKMRDNFENGMISEFLKNRGERFKKYPISTFKRNN